MIPCPDHHDPSGSSKPCGDAGGVHSIILDQSSQAGQEMFITSLRPYAQYLYPSPIFEPMASTDHENELRRVLTLPETIQLHVEFSPSPVRVASWSMYLPSQMASASAKRRSEFLTGRYCAAQALAKIGSHPPQWLGRNTNGLPCWPEGWLGSISHSGSGGWAAVGSRASFAALGIDMEHIFSERTMLDIQSQIAHPTELEVLSNLPSTKALTLLFSAKEALYKALYPRVEQFFDFSAARAISLQNNTLVLRLSQHWGLGWTEGSYISVRYAFRNNHVYTIAWVYE